MILYLRIVFQFFFFKIFFFKCPKWTRSQLSDVTYVLVYWLYLVVTNLIFIAKPRAFLFLEKIYHTKKIYIEIWRLFYPTSLMTSYFRSIINLFRNKLYHWILCHIISRSTNFHRCMTLFGTKMTTCHFYMNN